MDLIQYIKNTILNKDNQEVYFIIYYIKKIVYMACLE